MKRSLFIALTLLIAPLCLHAQSISGTVSFSGESKGTLFVYVRYYHEKSNKPVALKRYENPQFPVQFELSAKDALVPGMHFKGPFKVYGKLAPAEGRLWSSKTIFAKGQSEEGHLINVGDKNIQLEIK